MPTLKQREPVNLTALAERMPWPGTDQMLCVSGGLDRVGLEARLLQRSEEGQPHSGLSETVYVIAGGYGVLCWDDKTLDYNAGDVLFVPAGQPHRFARLDGEIRIWRISMTPVANGVGQQS